MTHTQKVYRYMKKHGTITDMEARQLLGVGRLSARIFELKALGVNITTDRVKVMNRDGGFSYIGSYRLERSKDEETGFD